MYRFLRDEVRPRVIQFIPGLELTALHQVAPKFWNPSTLPTAESPQARPGNTGSVVTEWSVDPDDWGHFLSRIWDEWFARDFGRVFVDQFENVVSQMCGYGAQHCVTAEVCGKALALEHNGDLFSCDHFVYPEYRLGNIAETHQGDLAFSEQQVAFGQSKAIALPAHCRACEYVQLCWGGCPKGRFIKTRDGEPGLNYLCSGLKAFYAKVISDRAELNSRLQLP